MTLAAIKQIQARLAEGIILDGGLATELERRGHDLRNPLWSARLLIEDPAQIAAVHRDYLAAGAECITSASYQASLPGLIAKGLSHQQAADVLIHSVQLARQAVEESGSHAMVAASVGPFGAYQADGSEFRGDYGKSLAELYDFHAPRLDILTAASPDLLACETIPTLVEAEALVRWLANSTIPAWITFSCRDGSSTCHGEPIAECAMFLDDVPSVVGIGVNCTSPSFITSLIERIREKTQKTIVVYPNSGQTWDAATRSWKGDAEIDSFVEQARQWKRVGASAIGGCCQTTPEHIRQLSSVLKRRDDLR